MVLLVPFPDKRDAGIYHHVKLLLNGWPDFFLAFVYSLLSESSRNQSEEILIFYLHPEMVNVAQSFIHLL